MTTMNISLPNALADQLDQMVNKFAFSSRSEFVRAILRRVMVDSSALEESVSFPFKKPVSRSTRSVMKAFKDEGKYSKVFLKDLKAGLDSSEYFKD